MKVFYIDVDSFCANDFIDSLQKYSLHGKKTEIFKYAYSNDGKWQDPDKESDMLHSIERESPDFAFSFNYYPLVSKSCQKAGLKYISWVYDNPQVALYHYTLANSCNEVFLFDSEMYETFASQGIKTVHYMPLAASTERLDTYSLKSNQESLYKSEVSFVGSLYTEEHNFYERMLPKLDPYVHGYLEGLIKSQMQIHGYNFIESSLTENIIEKMYAALPLEPHKESVETKSYLYADYVINRRITGVERTEYLKTIATKHTVDLYTKDASFTSPGIKNHGIVKYYDDMPSIFKGSDINLNISLRSIKKGIPLRCFDIMGCGAFLLSNFQEDFLKFFEPGVDFVFYESQKDLIDKIDYYLLHENERKKIAENAYEKIKKDHTFDVRVGQILNEAGIT